MKVARKAVTPATTARKAPIAKPAVQAGPVAKRTPVMPVAAATSAAPTPATASSKPEKPRKAKLVRDSFTIPKAEYLVLEALKQRAAKAGVPVKKSELLRAGIKALAGLDDAPLLAALGAVPTIKTGRPAKA
jgi:hypothetical protein